MPTKILLGLDGGPSPRQKCRVRFSTSKFEAQHPRTLRRPMNRPMKPEGFEMGRHSGSFSGAGQERRKQTGAAIGWGGLRPKGPAGSLNRAPKTRVWRAGQGKSGISKASQARGQR